MRIIETRTGYTPSVNIGRFGFFIIPSLGGDDITAEELAKQAACFDNVIISAPYADIFGQPEELGFFIKKTLRANEKTTFHIYTTAENKPIGFKTNNVQFYINIPLKSTGIEYKKRIKENTLLWFMNNNAYFIFEIQHIDEFDEAMLIMQNIGIPKHRTFMVPKSLIIILDKSFERNCHKYGLNFSYDFKGGEINEHRTKNKI